MATARGERSGAAFIHPSADVSHLAFIGLGTVVWHQAQVREGARIGDDCVIGKSVYVDRGVQVGNRVKIGNFVSVYAGVTIEDEVFVGPHATFTNDLYPRSFHTDWQVVPTQVERGASIGANATVRCGVRIGAYAMIGAGAVVTRDVPPFALAVGNPARVVGWVDRNGRPIGGALPPSGSETPDAVGASDTLPPPHA